MPSTHRLEFIPKDIPLRLLCTSYRSSVGAICHVLRTSHPIQRGSTQSELKSLRSFSHSFIQRPLNVVYLSSHVMYWATEIWILTYCLPSMYCPSLTEYTHLPDSAYRCFPPLIYFRTSRLGCLIFHAILTLLASPSIPCITFISALTALPSQFCCCHSLEWIG